MGGIIADYKREGRSCQSSYLNSTHPHGKIAYSSNRSRSSMDRAHRF